MMVNISIEKPNEKTKTGTIGFIVLYLLIVLGFVSIGPRLFASTWVSSSDFHSCIEITSSFIAIIAAVACLMYYFGFKNRYYLLCGLGFFICGSEDFIHGLFSFARLFSGIEADLSKFVPGTYVAGRSAFAIFIILSAVLSGRPRPSKNVRKETVFFSLIALIVGAGMTTLAIMLPLPRFIYPEHLISRPIDFISAVLFAVAFAVVLKMYLARRSIFSGFLLACILLNLGGQVYMSFSKQLFDAFFDTAHWANILSYCMPVLGIAVQALKEIKNSKRELTARKQADGKLLKHSEHLEELVGERTAELESANSELRHEIAERKQAEQALENQRNRVQSYLDAAEVMLLVIDINQKVCLINRKGCEVLGYSEKNITDKDWCDNFVPEPDRDEVRLVLSKLLSGEIKMPHYYENPVLTKSKQARLVAWRNTVLYDRGGKIDALLSSGEDIADRKQAEENLKTAYKELEGTNRELKEMQSQLVQNEKLASIGQLAAGVAHEMNTPVGFVASNFQTLESYVNKFKSLVEMYDDLVGQVETLGKAQLKKKAEDINQSWDDMKIDFILKDIQGLFDESKEGINRITTIIQNLRDFSRIDHAEEFEECHLNDGVNATLIVARNEIKYDADVKTDFGDLPSVPCNPGQINQVLLNILLNAAQAIKLREREDKGLITIKTYASENKAVIEIIDDGPGIAPDKLPKIFDPFFTTKPAGKGTGLGLSVSYDIIVNKHKGELLVDSTVGEGAKFTIKLPIKLDIEESEKEPEYNGAENSTIC